jgi:hypothetical protein
VALGKVSLAQTQRPAERGMRIMVSLAMADSRIEMLPDCVDFVVKDLPLAEIRLCSLMRSRPAY